MVGQKRTARVSEVYNEAVNLSRTGIDVGRVVRLVLNELHLCGRPVSILLTEKRCYGIISQQQVTERDNSTELIYDRCVDMSQAYVLTGEKTRSIFSNDHGGLIKFTRPSGADQGHIEDERMGGTRPDDPQGLSLAGSEELIVGGC
jgi:hypothetical protein